MNCEVAQERIVAATYGELGDELVHELEEHMTGCPECRKEREQMVALKVLADAYPVAEPEANLVARSRLRLEEALDALPPLRWYERITRRVAGGFTGLLAAPLAACLVLVAGVGAGSLGEYEMARLHAARATTAAATAPSSGVQVLSAPVADPVTGAEIAGVLNVVRQPDSGQVEVQYNQLVPRRISGSASDPAIRQLLVLASQNSNSTGVRDKSVDLLAAECRTGRNCREAGIRDALLVALKYDRNAGVRQKALKGLEPYVAQDVLVRDAVLEALMSDSDTKIRNTAISILEPVEADTSVRQVLHSVADTDENPYIRTVSRKVLSQVPEIQ
jgi:predicted anti-sigma-YlaC factor YlaD